MESKGKWTPRPWEVRQNDLRLCVKGTEHLFSIVHSYPHGTSTIVETIAENLELADAQVMAAAPMMVEALRKLIEEAPLVRGNVSGLWCYLKGWEESARAALAAAEGRGDE